ncbi:MAG TPA: sugar ABC transporter substrate-binding protein [Burkholderiales bacterium]|jgi:ribose transport system substrate-binding protein|nr:sugar ABC transporter substrate-binding protein [Burkholderiales bacterium]
MNQHKLSALVRTFVVGLALLSASGITTVHAQEQKKFKVYLSMFASGGGWLTAASNSIKALAATPPYDKMVDLKEVISGPDAPAQIAAYESMIASGADAIITIPASVTALNRTIRRGCDKGVIFFTFGYSVSEPCAYQVHAITNGFGENGGQVMANLLHGKGKILVNHAFPGGPADKRHYDGFLSVIKKYPDMQVVAETWGRASDEVSQTEAAKVLAAHPDIDGVFTQPGELGIIKAFLASGRQKLPVVVGESGNGFRLALADPELRRKGLNGVSSGGTPAEAAFGFKVMMEILTKQREQPFRRIAYPLPWVMADDVKVCSGDRFEKGCNVFPRDKVPDTLFVTVMWPPELLPELSLTAVLEGKPTPGATIQKITATLMPQPDTPGVNCEKCTAPPDLYRVTKVKPFDANQQTKVAQ